MLRNRSRMREKRESIRAFVYYSVMVCLGFLFLYGYIQIESLNTDKQRLANRTRALSETNAELIRVMRSNVRPEYLDTME